MGWKRRKSRAIARLFRLQRYWKTLNLATHLWFSFAKTRSVWESLVLAIQISDTFRLANPEASSLEYITFADLTCFFSIFLYLSDSMCFKSARYAPQIRTIFFIQPANAYISHSICRFLQPQTGFQWFTRVSCDRISIHLPKQISDLNFHFQIMIKRHYAFTW